MNVESMKSVYPKETSRKLREWYQALKWDVKVLLEAADLIESMAKELDSMRVFTDNLSARNEELHKANIQLEAQVPKWISVEDAMPPLGTEVLVYATEKIEGFGTTYALCEYRNARTIFGEETDRPEWSTPWQYFHTDYKITHWMPLPPAPEVER